MGFSQGHRSTTAGTRRHHGRSVTSGSMSVSGSIRGAELYFIHGASNFNTAATKFLPMGYNDVESAGATFLNRFVAPCRGRWVETLVRSSVAADHTLMKLYKAVDATANPATLVETANLDLAAAATTYALTSSTGFGQVQFNKGDVIAFRMDPGTQPDLTNFTHVLELYTRFDIP